MNKPVHTGKREEGGELDESKFSIKDVEILKWDRTLQEEGGREREGECGGERKEEGKRVSGERLAAIRITKTSE